MTLNEIPCAHHVKGKLKLPSELEREEIERAIKHPQKCNITETAVCSQYNAISLTFYFETNSRKWRRIKSQSDKRPSSKMNLPLFLT